VTTRDLSVADGVDAITQAIANRLKTRKGELASLGHPDYGSQHHSLIGEPNVERTRDLIKLYVLQALRNEPRIEKVLKADVAAEHTPPRESVRITLSVRLIRESTPLNLVIPFSLETSL
jgi:phage baseplate assembly protein W